MKLEIKYYPQNPKLDPYISNKLDEYEQDVHECLTFFIKKDKSHIILNWYIGRKINELDFARNNIILEKNNIEFPSLQKMIKYILDLTFNHRKIDKSLKKYPLMILSYSIMEKNVNLTKQIILDYYIKNEELEVLISQYN